MSRLGCVCVAVFFFSSRRRHTRCSRDWSSDVCSSDLGRSLLVEEFVPGREVAVEGLVTHGALHVLALFDKPDPLDGPFFEETIYVTPSRLARTAQQEIAACAQAAGDALGLRDGPIHAEVRHNDPAAWAIELAPRPIGGRCSGALRVEIRGAGNGER